MVNSQTLPADVHSPLTLAEELRTVPVFADLPADGLDWLASQMTRIAKVRPPTA